MNEREASAQYRVDTFLEMYSRQNILPTKRHHVKFTHTGTVQEYNQNNINMLQNGYLIKTCDTCQRSRHPHSRLAENFSTRSTRSSPDNFRGSQRR